jgi:hypothetical protein
MIGCGLTCSDSGQGHVILCCEEDNQTVGSNKCGESFDQLRAS